jgi:hypothetical protein
MTIFCLFDGVENLLVLFVLSFERVYLGIEITALGFFDRRSNLFGALLVVWLFAAPVMALHSALDKCNNVSGLPLGDLFDLRQVTELIRKSRSRSNERQKR